jgi:pimeloyl-ACP methyl ester carboxylesterase
MMNTRRADILTTLGALGLPVTTDPNKFTLPGLLVEPVITVKPGTVTQWEIEIPVVLAHKAPATARAFDWLEDQLVTVLDALAHAGFGVEADIVAYDHPDGTMPGYRVTCTTYT